MRRIAAQKEDAVAARWYHGVTSYQWLVLVIASAGWVFDAFEGQVFNITRNDLLAETLRAAHNAPEVRQWGDMFLGVFLAGGAFGGILFGSLADRWGRKPVMVTTILFYSVFAGLTYFATELWQVGTLRFLVAMGVGGEWAVAATLVAEVFPKHARAHASGIFHATSTLGTWAASAVGLAVGAQWRYAYLISVLPALLVLWVWSRVKEPESWQQARDKAATGGGWQARQFSRAVLPSRLGTARASRHGARRRGARHVLECDGCRAGPRAGSVAAKRCGIGRGGGESEVCLWRHLDHRHGCRLAVSFGPLCVRLGRRRTFILLQGLSLVVVPATCYLPATYHQLLLFLPLMGFATLSIHAGFAIYFPELFPNHLRSTGAGFCFNAGRLVAAPVLIFSGWLKALPGMNLPLAITLMSLLFALGIVVVLFLPETKDQPLPE